MKRKFVEKGYQKNKKIRSSDSYYPSSRRSSGSSRSSSRPSVGQPNSPELGSRRRSSGSSSGMTYSSSSSKKSVYSGSSAGKALSEVAGGALSIYTGVPFLDAAAGSLYDYANTTNFTQNKMVGGTYQGNFKKPKRYGDNMESKCLKHGYHYTDETYGKVSDSSCVYLTHSTWDAIHMAKTVAGASIRQLLRKAGINVDERASIMPLGGIATAAGMEFQFNYQNPLSGAVVTISYATVAGETLGTITETNWAAYWQILRDMFLGVSLLVPLSLCLYADDLHVGATQKRLLAQFDMSNAIVTFYAVSDIKVQNRTTPDTGTAGNMETDRIDAQPLVGSLYNFNGDPKFKKLGVNNTSSLPLQGVPYDKVKLLRAADLTFDGNSTQNRPSAHLWSNCNRMANVVLQPGVIKRGVVSHYMAGRFVNLLPKLRAEAVLTTTDVYGVKCKAQLLVFEECIRTAGTNHITVQYERKLRIGCMIREVKRNVPIKSALQFQVLDKV